MFAASPSTRQLEQVRAFPHASRGVCRAEGAQVFPGLQVRRAVKHHLWCMGLDGDHDPVAAGRSRRTRRPWGPGSRRSRGQAPGCRRIWSRSCRRPCCRRGTGPAVPACGEPGLIGAGVDGHQRRMLPLCRIRWCIAVVHHDAAGKDVLVLIAGDGNGCSVQCSRSVEVAWPQDMLPQTLP